MNDLQNLFIIIKRFIDFYQDKKLFTLIKPKILEGLEKLMITYQDKPATIQTLEICKLLLKSNDNILNNIIEKKGLSNILVSITEIYSDSFLELLYYFIVNIDENNTYINNYYISINNIFELYHIKIKSWINRFAK